MNASAKGMCNIGPICLGYVPFRSRGRVKICFVFDPLDGVIGQFADIENERFFEKSRLYFLVAMSPKDTPPSR